jgi:GH15 family glucan-1,4-alpha-glucosidase
MTSARTRRTSCCGASNACSFWLVWCLARAGELERAEQLFDQLTGYANDLGLLAEEIDTARGELLGNFPQAFSHIGLINAAHEIDTHSE